MRMNNRESNVKYIDRFYDSPFSPYDFLSLFSALYVQQEEYFFDRDKLVEFIASCKRDDKYNNLLDDIHLKNNGIHSYSEDFDEAVAKLKWAHILYTVSPEVDSTIYIFEDTPFIEMMKTKTNFIDEMTNFIVEFKEYEIRKVKEYQKQIS